MGQKGQVQGGGEGGHFSAQSWSPNPTAVNRQAPNFFLQKKTAQVFNGFGFYADTQAESVAQDKRGGDGGFDPPPEPAAPKPEPYPEPKTPQMPQMASHKKCEPALLSSSPWYLLACGHSHVAYGHTTGNTPEPVRFQKLSLVRPS